MAERESAVNQLANRLGGMMGVHRLPRPWEYNPDSPETVQQDIEFSRRRLGTWRSAGERQFKANRHTWRRAELPPPETAPKQEIPATPAVETWPLPAPLEAGRMLAANSEALPDLQAQAETRVPEPEPKPEPKPEPVLPKVEVEVPAPALAEQQAPGDLLSRVTRRVGRWAGTAGYVLGPLLRHREPAEVKPSTEDEQVNQLPVLPVIGEPRRLRDSCGLSARQVLGLHRLWTMAPVAPRDSYQVGVDGLNPIENLREIGLEEAEIRRLWHIGRFARQAVADGYRAAETDTPYEQLPDPPGWDQAQEFLKALNQKSVAVTPGDVHYYRLVYALMLRNLSRPAETPVEQTRVEVAKPEPDESYRSVGTLAEVKQWLEQGLASQGEARVAVGSAEAVNELAQIVLSRAAETPKLGFKLKPGESRLVMTDSSVAGEVDVEAIRGGRGRPIRVFVELTGDRLAVTTDPVQYFGLKPERLQPAVGRPVDELAAYWLGEILGSDYQITSAQVAVQGERLLLRVKGGRTRLPEREIEAERPQGEGTGLTAIDIPGLTASARPAVEEVAAGKVDGGTGIESEMEVALPGQPVDYSLPEEPPKATTIEVRSVADVRRTLEDNLNGQNGEVHLGLTSESGIQEVTAAVVQDVVDTVNKTDQLPGGAQVVIEQSGFVAEDDFLRGSIDLRAVRDAKFLNRRVLVPGSNVRVELSLSQGANGTEWREVVTNPRTIFKKPVEQIIQQAVLQKPFDSQVADWLVGVMGGGYQIRGVRSEIRDGSIYLTVEGEKVGQDGR